MTQAKHTPGPWRIGYTRVDGYNFSKIETGKKNKYGRVKYIATVDISNDKANAKLIAAAPDLLHAVELLKIAIQGGNPQAIAETLTTYGIPAINKASFIPERKDDQH